MTSNKHTAIGIHRPFVSTDEFAAHNLVKPQSVRKRFSQTGEYFGVRPTKLPNGRLLWPEDSRTMHSKGGV